MATNTLRHLACIMDGNRRWAYARKLPLFIGHRHGLDAVVRVIDFCLDHHIPYLSLYLFSLENMQRSAEETRHLFTWIVDEADRFIRDAHEKNLAVRFVGDRTLFPLKVRNAVTRIEQETAAGNALSVDLLFCYGGQQEIVQAVQHIAHAIQRGGLSADMVTQETVERSLWTFPAPPPDLIIRTGGYSRLSGFQLYHAAYAELRFLNCLWPDLRTEDIQKVVDEFYQCVRKFGS